MKRFVLLCIAASLVFAGQPALAQSVSDKMGELTSLRDEVVNALKAAVS